MNSLITRLSLALLLIMIVVGGAFYALEQWGAQRYHEEVTQRLNADIAMYVTGQTTLMHDGAVNREELERLAERAMVINPSVEVYLLGRDGAILGHALPPETILRQSVELGPVTELIAGDAKLPLYGTDPRNPQREKVFSAAPVMDEDTLQGYLYVVLGGSKYDMLAGAVRDSYVRNISVLAIAALVIGGGLAGHIVFTLLTRRLTRLTRDVEAFSNVALDPDADPEALLGFDTRSGDGKGDEISTLSDAFAAMASKIREQFLALQENDRLRRELISNVSHDLRTPLASMHGYVDTLLLKNRELDADQREQYLEITRKHTQRLGELIGDLFELSKLDSGSMPLALETFSLAELLNDVVQEFALEARRRDIDLRLAGEPDRALVHADIGLVQRVLENLIRNALEYTPAGGSITLDVSAQQQDVAVTVADTGCGIPDDEIENIFERYFRSSHGRSSRGQSSGLGLAIVKRILDLHGSRITVASRVNEGTRFEFNLPSAAAA
ncbi:HAMP domain-containing histidine kinase [Mangrovimicrobium sediminis]|uniref:histidine kinase n=1 Tax=Mangrovimicrobium sediminis TaxID=2562682 RepID=A0A4Z0LYT9_9GAMM|nr:HAMP domain-containing sensor histidine kinase [Haliea sp. SAOS-164]TGD72288.1 HAMP domain-containing histidine kinase [Haliea sp. SAOS-164]